MTDLSDRLRRIERHHFDEAKSTNMAALDWMKSSEPGQEAFFTTDVQTAGRGQRNRLWTQQAAEDVAWTYAKHFPTHHHTEFRNLFILNMAISMAVKTCIQDSVTPHSSDTFRIKWPNDLYAKDQGIWKKCGGMLIENQWKGTRLTGMAVGVGINLHSKQQWADRTSLQNISHTEPQRTGLLKQLEQKVVDILDQAATWRPVDMQTISKGYHTSLLGLNEVQNFEWREGKSSGKLLQIDQDGQAHIQWMDGAQQGQVSIFRSSENLRWIF